MLVFDMSDEQLVEVTGDHPAFASSSFAGMGFVIKAKPLTREQYAIIQKRHTKVTARGQQTDDLAVEMDMFIRCVVSWEGIVDQIGTPLPCNDETKRTLANKHWQFSGMVNSAITDLQSKQDESRNIAKGN